jgi:aryl-alcohol dehydrogenase-like predicted oxidoreductase
VSIGGNAGRAAREWYERESVALFAYSALARGFFSEAFHSPGPALVARARFPGMHGDTEWLRRVLLTNGNVERYRRAVELARDRGVTPAQIGLAYVLHLSPRVFAIAGWNMNARLAENVAALDVELTSAEISWLGGTDE